MDRCAEIWYDRFGRRLQEARYVDLMPTTERDIDEIWPRGELGQYVDYSFQYATGIEAGRAVVVATNTVVDIAGDASAAALGSHARQLLERVVRRDVHAPAMPVLGGGRTVAVSALRDSDSETSGENVAAHGQDSHKVNIQHSYSRLILKDFVTQARPIAYAQHQG